MPLHDAAHMGASSRDSEDPVIGLSGGYRDIFSFATRTQHIANNCVTGEAHSVITQVGKRCDEVPHRGDNCRYKGGGLIGCGWRCRRRRNAFTCLTNGILNPCSNNEGGGNGGSASKYGTS